MSAFYIDGTPIKNPQGFKIELYTLTNSVRTANGDMVMEFVANKRKFILSYQAIESKELNKIIDILWTSLVTTKKVIHELRYLDDGVWKTAQIYSGSIPKDLHRAGGQDWVWKNVTISLIER